MTTILSIKPYYLYLILLGKKTIELRKSYPKRPEWDKTAYLYCTKDMQSFTKIPKQDQDCMRSFLGKIACRVIIDDIDTVAVFNDILHCVKNTQPNKLSQLCLSIEEIKEYLGKKNEGYDLHIGFVTYFEPREITEFVHASVKFGKVRTATMRKESPPQSWCYALEVK